MKLKSPLSYPGGKSKALNTIFPMIPRDVKKLASPFLGGASIELECVRNGIEVYGYDNLLPLVNFWQQMVISSGEVASRALPYCLSMNRDLFYKLRDELVSRIEDDPVDAAAVFFTLNKSAFSGMLSGYSNSSARKIGFQTTERVKNMIINPNLFHVSLMDYRESLLLHENDFLYVDPPYNVSGLFYGAKGAKNKDNDEFDHKALADILLPREKWILSYNDDEYIRDLYKSKNIISVDWNYSMSRKKKFEKKKDCSEIIVFSDDAWEYYQGTNIASNELF